MAAAPQQQPGHDSGLGPLWIIAGIFAVVIFIWWKYSQQIVTFVFSAKLYEAYLISYVTSSITPIITAVQSTDAASVSFREMALVSKMIGEYTRYPFMIVLAWLAFLLYRSDITSNFKTKYNMNQLAMKEVVNWPQITPVLHLNLAAQNINEGPWAMATPPLEFAKMHGLLKIERYKRRARNNELQGKYTINRGEAKRVFTMQLGPYWEGLDTLPMYQKALFAIFIAKHGRDAKSANELVTQINLSSNKPQLNFSGTEELLAKHINDKKIQQLMRNHAYVLTLMASLLEAARTNGVFATADFIWLKPIDRSLWYMLNTVGRQVPFTEVAGPFSHWRVERELHRKLLVPMVDTAVDGLEIAISEIKYVLKDGEDVA